MAAGLLINYLLLFGSLNEKQIDLIREKIQSKKLEKGQYFLQAGQLAKEVGFVIEGVFRIFYFDKHGNEITRYFIEENNFIVDMNSYQAGLPGTEYIQAVTDSELVVIRKQALEELSATIIGWDSIVSKITAKALTEKVMKVSLMMPEEARARYELFLDKYPNLVNRIPLQYIASYIGITKSSLSRIRKEISG